MNNKIIIFIGGTSRSGSTLLDLILANDPRAMSLGEIQALFRPIKKKHFKEIERFKNDPKWSQILEDDKRKLYPNLINLYPDVDVFVDSSKDPFWFRLHEKNKLNYYEIKNILIYKTPEELAQSFMKRGNKKGWIRTYINYHKKYFSLTDNFFTISYKSLIRDDSALERLCEWLGIEFFKEKKNYWKNKFSLAFGSNSVKFVYDIDGQNNLIPRERNNLAYDEPEKWATDFALEMIKNHSEIKRIYDFLTFCENRVNYNNAMDISNKHNMIVLNIIALKYFFKLKYLYITGRYFR